MDFLTIDMVKMHCRIEFYDPDPGRQAEIDKNIKEQANKAEQEVYARIGRNYFDIIKTRHQTCCKLQSTGSNISSDHIFESRLVDWNLATAQTLNLLSIDIHTGHVDTHLRETRSRDQTNVSRSYNRNLHIFR